MSIFRIVFIFYSISLTAFGQHITQRDSLRGGLPFERSCYDILRYDLDLTIQPKQKQISGSNIITFRTTEITQKIQLDLFENMIIDNISSPIFGTLPYYRTYDAVWILFPELLPKHTTFSIQVTYHGIPTEAKNAPWDGGFVWEKDANGKDFIGVAVQGTGASLWYPCKESQSDEPDQGASITLHVPQGLMGISNGRLLSTSYISSEKKPDFSTWIWEVKNPINNYNITLYIGDYIHFSDKIQDLDINYYVLRANKDIAQKHFAENVKPMLMCFQEKFGTYPFIEDGYKLVESPYLGMEHQSAVAYGNHYKKGYRGRDLSDSGIGLLFDFIIIHESAHEWFGNSITSKDIADMWIHEAFTSYSEAVFVECFYGYDKASEYINGQGRMVENKKPIIGQFGVNLKPKSTDMYYKGALMLHTLRHVIDNDSLWWLILLDYTQHFKHKIIESKDVFDFFDENSKMTLSPIFRQYLHHSSLPEIVIELTPNGFYYSWRADEPEFAMPIDINMNGIRTRLYPKAQRQFYPLKSNEKNISFFPERFYVKTTLL